MRIINHHREDNDESKMVPFQFASAKQSEERVKREERDRRKKRGERSLRRSALDQLLGWRLHTQCADAVFLLDDGVDLPRVLARILRLLLLDLAIPAAAAERAVSASNPSMPSTRAMRPKRVK